MTTEKKNKPIRYPQKVGINLNMYEKRMNTNTTFFIGIAAVVLVVGAVAKFGVYDQYARLSAAAETYERVHQEYQKMETELADYEEVLTQYRMYSRDWMTQTNSDEEEEEFSYVSVDRLEILDLIDQEMRTRGDVTAVYISGDAVSVGMSGMSLDEISAMFSELEKHDIVAGAALDVAETAENSPASELRFTVNITLKGAETK